MDYIKQTNGDSRRSEVEMKLKIIAKKNVVEFQISAIELIILILGTLFL